MGMFLPEDIANRITYFIEGRLQFPFIKGEEIMGVFFVFGKTHGLSNRNDVIMANDLAKRTVATLTSTAYSYRTSAAAHDSTFIRHSYTKRVLELSEEMNRDSSMSCYSQGQRNARIAGDPKILADCYAQHVAHFQQDQIFELFQPLNGEHLPSLLRKKLERRMILLGYNVKDKTFIHSSSTLVPFLRWLTKIET